VSELGPNAFGEPVEAGRVDCYLGLPLPADEEDGDGVGGVLVVAPRWLLHPAVPSPPAAWCMSLRPGIPTGSPASWSFSPT
jgi:hypothetical protein